LEPVGVFYRWQMSRVQAYRTTAAAPRVTTKVLRANGISRRSGAAAGSVAAAKAWCGSMGIASVGLRTKRQYEHRTKRQYVHHQSL
jgi:hypothetical protein